MASLPNRREQEFSFRLAGLILSVCAVCAHGQSAGSTPDSVKDAGIAEISDGTISGNVYRNPDLGFRYEFPKGWAVNDKKTQREAIAAKNQFAWTEDVSPRRKSKAGRQCAKGLLFATHHPEEMHTNDFNPLVALIVADPQCIPGVSFPGTVKDQDGIQRIASNLGLYVETLSIRETERPRVHAFENSGRVILEITARYFPTVVEPATMTSLEIVTSTVVIPVGKYWLVCMFIGGDDAQLAWLRATRMIFDSPPAAPPQTKGSPESH